MKNNNYICRTLEPLDYHNGFLQCLAHLTSTPMISEVQFNEIYQQYTGKVYVIVDDATKLIIATASLIIENNIFEQIGHIENVVTLPEYRGQGLAKQLIQCIIDDSKMKLDLYCKTENSGFYDKFGFKIGGVISQIYL